MAGKVIDLNEYRRARLAEEYAAAILECDISDILRNCGLDPADLANDAPTVKNRRYRISNPGDAGGEPPDPL